MTSLQYTIIHHLWIHDAKNLKDLKSAIGVLFLGEEILFCVANGWVDESEGVYSVRLPF